MQIKIPHFKYRSKKTSNNNYGCIELGEEVIHEIRNLDEFHKALGYTVDMAKAGILPDEYIWEKYIKDTETRCHTCFQLHIIEYLLKHSATFREKYKTKSEEWIGVQAVAKLCVGIVCPACKTNRHTK